ncbi:hypothetical protein ACPCSP_19430 [Streptomyces cinereoruber]|uniref:hypothetical protein n=1 Tax=Streptomyces cinereoruber TaxID=67260 RepID=UPI003C2E417B
MGRVFEDIDRLDVEGHVRRWSSPDADKAEGEVSEWMAAAEMFASRICDAAERLPGERWPEVASAWSSLLTAAERATGSQRAEWLVRDLWLRSRLLGALGPQPGAELLERDPVLDRALDAMPMTQAEAAALGPAWRDLDKERVLELRLIKRLLAPARRIGYLLVEHPRRAEFLAWEAVLPSLP